MSIFISYKRVDKQRVFEIKRLIEENTGQSCWIDIDGIESDAQFVSVIMRAINECELFLFMYSKTHSEITDFERDWTIREINFAKEKQKRIVFVNIDGSELSDLFVFYFGLKQQVDSRDREAMKHLCNDVKKWLGGRPVIPAPDTGNANNNPVEQSLIPYEKNGKYGFVNTEGILVVDCIYDEVKDFSEGLARVYVYNYNIKDWFVGSCGKYGFINAKGEVVVKCEYTNAWEFSEGLACVQMNLDGKFGYIDRTGNVVIEFKYDAAQNFSEGLAGVKLGGKFGYINVEGKLVVECEYDSIAPFSEGLAKVSVIKNKQSPLKRWFNGDDHKYGFIDKNGKTVIECKYDWIDDFSEGLAVASLDGKLGYIDRTGNIVIRSKYDSVEPFSEGLARVCLNNKYGFIDKTGREVISCKYDYADDFSQGEASVELDDKCGFIDKYGNFSEEDWDN